MQKLTRIRVLDGSITKCEDQLKEDATYLSFCRDQINQGTAKNDQLESEIRSFLKQTHYFEQQIDQEKKDQEIVVKDIWKVQDMLDRRIGSGKLKFKEMRDKALLQQS